MDISIIIVSFNTRDILDECLTSLENLKAKEIEEIWVVDNASSDGSHGMVEKKHPKVRLIANQENLGFAKANNLALKKAKGDYFLLLNSDTRISKASMDSLVNYIKDNPNVGIIGARLKNLDGSIQPSVYHLPTLFRAIKEYWFGQKGEYEKYIPKENNPIQVEAVTGAALLVKREIMEKIGYLNEKYFMYFEDLDFCRKAKILGFKIIYLPEFEVAHHHGASGKNSKTYDYLVSSAKKYHGVFKYYSLYFIIRLGSFLRK